MQSLTFRKLINNYFCIYLIFIFRIIFIRSKQEVNKDALVHFIEHEVKPKVNDERSVHFAESKAKLEVNGDRLVHFVECEVKSEMNGGKSVHFARRETKLEAKEDRLVHFTGSKASDEDCVPKRSMEYICKIKLPDYPYINE